MKIKEISQRVREIRSEYRSMYTNVNWSNLDLAADVEIFDNHKGIAFLVPETNKTKVYYAAADREGIAEILERVPEGVVLEYFYKRENDMNELFECAGFSHYADYFRVTTMYEENPYGKETGKRKLLDELYDPECGEYPALEDVEELEKLLRDQFDPLTDDVFSKEEWTEIIKKKECLVIKENGKIVTCHVWRLSGKKLYGNISLNLGPANYMYNLERRVFDSMWEAGIRVNYAWFNEKNTKAFTKNGLTKEAGDLYDAIYIKQ